MYVRVVRFTDVAPERVQESRERIEASGGPPEGVRATGLQLLYDESQRTAVVLQLFDSAEDMQQAEAVFSGMDASDTPGTRVSVDRCEQKLEVHADR